MAPNHTITTSKKKGRSRVTNGKSLFAQDIDHRSLYYRRFRDLITLLSDDLGGADHLSVSEAAILRTAATHVVALEQLEFKFANGEGEASTADLMVYQTLSNSLRRLLKELGIKRRSKDMTPDLQTYLRQKAAEREAMTIDHDDRPRSNGHHKTRAS